MESLDNNEITQNSPEQQPTPAQQPTPTPEQATPAPAPAAPKPVTGKPGAKPLPKPKEKPAPKPEDKDKKKGGAAIHIVYILLILAIAGGGAYFFMKNKEADQKVVDISIEKETLTSEKQKEKNRADSLIAVLESQKGDNVRLNEELTRQQDELKQLKWKLDRAQSGAQVAKYKKEINVMTDQLKDNYGKMDSLIKVNQALAAKTQEQASQLEQLQKAGEEKSAQIATMSSKIERASSLKAMGVIAVPNDEKGKLQLKSKKVRSIEISGKIAENKVLEPGNRTIYARIVGPGDVVLTVSTNNTFKFGSEDLIYSETQEISYQGDEESLKMSHRVQGIMKPGTYKVVLFCEGKEIGNTTFGVK